MAAIMVRLRVSSFGRPPTVRPEGRDRTSPEAQRADLTAKGSRRARSPRLPFVARLAERRAEEEFLLADRGTQLGDRVPRHLPVSQGKAQRFAHAAHYGETRPVEP